MQLNATRGIAMLTALFTLVLVSGLAMLMFTRNVQELRHSRDDAAIAQTLLLARGAANLGAATLDGSVRAELDAVVTATADSAGRWAYGEGAGDSPDGASVARDLRTVVSGLQPRVDALLCDRTVIPNDTSAVLTLRIHVAERACSEALPPGVRLASGRLVEGQPRGLGATGLQMYALPYVIVAEAVLGEYRRNIVLQGEYRFQVGRRSFARYAYFTNEETGEDHRGNLTGRLWFTQSTMIDGPTHTNGNFAFAYDPWFGGEVTTAGCSSIAGDGRSCAGSSQAGAYLYATYRCTRYSDGRCVAATNFFGPQHMSPNANRPSYRYASPGFSQGVDWRSDYVPLPDSDVEQRDVARGVDRDDEGLFLPDDLTLLHLEARGADGRPLAPDGRGGYEPEAAYQVVLACHDDGACGAVRIDADGNVEVRPVRDPSAFLRGDDDEDAWSPRATRFNGVIYVDGDVERLRGPRRADAADPASSGPALASFSAITVATAGDVRIAGDVKYETPPCEGRPVRNADRSVTPMRCDDLQARNVLGVYTRTGNILVGNNHSDASLNAPDHAHVHASLMTSRGVIAVEDFRNGAPRGDFVLLGGMIQNRRGAFGTFNGDGPVSGFSRVYTYDQRFRMGVAPPFFPTTEEDGVNAVWYLSYGQREQVY